PAKLPTAYSPAPWRPPRNAVAADPHPYTAKVQPVVGVIALEGISYLKLSGSRLARRTWVVSACGCMKKPTGAPVDAGSATSLAKLYAIQFSSRARLRHHLVLQRSISSGISNTDYLKRCTSILQPTAKLGLSAIVTSIPR